MACRYHLEVVCFPPFQLICTDTSFIFIWLYRYERPAMEYFQVENTNMKNLQKDKTLVLWTVAVRGCVIWGLLMHLLMINLIVTSVTDEALRRNDIVFGSISLVFAFLIIPCTGFVVMRILKAKIEEAEWRALSPLARIRQSVETRWNSFRERRS
jgi:ABC-type Fe3+ transport system permease subunit